MFIGPTTLVLKVFCMSSELVSRRSLSIRIAALLISKLRPSLPARVPTCLAHSFMLDRSVVSDEEIKKVKQQLSDSLIYNGVMEAKAGVCLDRGEEWRV